MLGRLALTKTEAALLAGAVVYCCAILWIDLRSATDFTTPLLYGLALSAAYPIRRDWAIWLVTVIAIGFTVAGWLLAGATEPSVGGLMNRGATIVLLVALGFLVWRVTKAESALFRLSAFDALTGAVNRGHFLTLMTREQRRADRYGTRFSLLMLDIDHFKRLNDAHGLPTGEAALRRTAETCLRHMRPTDLMCRYTGEQFIIALTHTEDAGAEIAAERMREAVAKIELKAEGAAVRFTASIGVSHFAPGVPIERLIECAEQALHAAKQGGRNQVRVGQVPGTVASTPAAASA
jgi:diguanylate cyclase (GGDEF)-like protein